MQLVARSEVLSKANPRLVFFAVRPDGWLVDVHALSFQIWSASSQVYPPTGRQAVDLVADRVALGQYAAAWSVPGAQATGRYEVRWFFELTDGDAEATARDVFEIVAAADRVDEGPFYAGPTDLVGDEGLVGVSSARLIQAIGTASRMLEMFTRNFFEPRRQSLRISGDGGAALFLSHAISALGAVTLNQSLLDAENVLVFNRHLHGHAEDRGNPKLERLTGEWVRGRLNITLDAVMGHLFAGLPWGTTPATARQAVKLLTLLEVGTMTGGDREAARNRYRLVSESTRDQSYTMSPSHAGGRGFFYVGDPEIDTLIHGLRAPLGIGVA